MEVTLEANQWALIEGFASLLGGVAESIQRLELAVWVIVAVFVVAALFAGRRARG